MRENIIYLQSSFWQKLREDSSIAGLGCLIDIYNAMSVAELRTDICDELWDTDDFLKLLWKKHISGQSSIDLFESLTFDSISDRAEDLCAIYLIDCDDDTCCNFGEKYGVKVVNNQELPKKEILFKGDGFSLDKKVSFEDRFNQFKDIIKQPCNSLILIDPYILSKPESMDNNLPYLFDALLPTKKMQVQFHLSVYSMTDSRGVKDNANNVYEKIANYIRALRKGLKYSLTLCVIDKSGDFHRRMLITNNILLDAPDGFDVFTSKGTSCKNAKYDIVFPRLIGNNRQDMSEYLRWIKISKLNLEYKSNKTIGDKTNRLFDIVQ